MADGFGVPGVFSEQVPDNSRVNGEISHEDAKRVLEVVPGLLAECLQVLGCPERSQVLEVKDRLDGTIEALERRMATAGKSRNNVSILQNNIQNLKYMHSRLVALAKRLNEVGVVRTFESEEI